MIIKFYESNVSKTVAKLDEKPFKFQMKIKIVERIDSTEYLPHYAAGETSIPTPNLHFSR